MAATVRLFCSARCKPSAKGCNMRISFALVCAEPFCSMRAGPTSVVALLTGCANLVRNELPYCSVTFISSYRSYLPHSCLESWLAPSCEFSSSTVHGTKSTSLFMLRGSFSDIFWLCCANCCFSFICKASLQINSACLVLSCLFCSISVLYGVKWVLMNRIGTPDIVV